MVLVPGCQWKYFGRFTHAALRRCRSNLTREPFPAKRAFWAGAALCRAELFWSQRAADPRRQKGSEGKARHDRIRWTERPRIHGNDIALPTDTQLRGAAGGASRRSIREGQGGLETAGLPGCKGAARACLEAMNLLRKAPNDADAAPALSTNLLR